MALGVQSPEVLLQGFDATFDPDLDEKYKCPVCLVALRDPVQTKCGHRFCRMCLKQSRGKALYGKCPVDKTWFDPARHVFEDNAVKREVLSLQIKCDNLAEGCDWKGELRNREKHAASCPDGTVKCGNKCGHTCRRRDVTKHAESCPMRRESCQKCGLVLVASQIAKHQLLVCEKFPVTCPVCGETDIIRESVSRHVDVTNGDCPMVVIKCPFSDIGCYFQDKRKNMATHHKSAHLHHMQLMMMKLQLQTEMINSQQRQLADLTDNCHQLNTINDQQNSMISGQGCLIQLQAACLRELEHDDVNNGRLLWRMRIPDERNARITSPGFYTHCHGYKVSLVLDTTRDATNTSEALASVYLDMENSQDTTNVSPFDGTCHVTIFNQLQQTETFKKSFSCRLGDDQNLGTSPNQGLFKFMPLGELFSATYNKDGGMLILVELKPDQQTQ